MDTAIPSGFSLFEQDLNIIATQTDDVLYDFENGNVFITGASGFFGIWLVEAFLWMARERQLNLTVTVLLRDAGRFFTRYPHLRDNPALRWVEGDLETFEFPVQSVSHIIHAASVPNLDGRDSWASEHVRAGVLGMSRILKLAEEKKIRSLLVTSSGGVYTSVLECRGGNGFVEEVDSISALTSEKIVYGQTKRMMEIMSAAEARKHGFKLAIARCFAFVGPYLPMDANYAIGNFIRDARERKCIVISGDGTPLRSYLYAADLAASLIRLLVKCRSGVPYNIAGTEVLSIKQLGLLVAKCHGMPNESVKIMTPATPDAPINQYLADINKARNDGLLCNSTSLVDAIARTSKWLDLKA
ncbi:NAD(P)-dependent oxidoreductase [Chromobacterium sp. ASV23]|uniref:NAD-dependent epimerase/dehydratase family protein n=1 Tax=Chromobacterium sp. ASV23 TaxID=2795110 RepID=UPI0018ED1768|nr:NAD(P)-dependent oxidoreductase [Chromobacterium sp. ASV23]